MKIICVEDNLHHYIIQRDILQEYLSNIDILNAETGDRGIKMILAMKPDIVFCDLKLPDMTGYEVCREVRKAGYFKRFYFVTGSVLLLDNKIAAEAGANGLVVKGAEYRDFRKLIENLIVPVHV